MSSRAAILRLIFAACAISVALGLSFRPIPSDDAPNDTGRYVGNQLQACALPASGNSSVTHDSTVAIHSAWGTLPGAGEPFMTVPMRAFNLLMRPACVGGNPRLFLFWAAMALPVALLLFANWNLEGTLLLAGGMLFSTVGFEFMNNALRQGVGMAFLMGGFYYQNRFAKWSALLAALVLHDSNWFFVPLALLIAYSTGTRSMKTMLLWALPILAGLGCLFILRFISSFDLLSTGFSIYEERYAEEASVPFLLFIISPVIFVFVIRLLDRNSKATNVEKITFWYSMALLTLSIVVFPAITYRFAMSAITLQVFMAMRSSSLSVRSGGVIAFGLISHFMIYAAFAKNVVALIYG